MLDDLVTTSVALPGGELRLLQPREAAELPDIAGVEWAPVVPYWSVPWRSGIALAAELEDLDLQGKRVVELGCGLGVPSLTAARSGASVLATDAEPEALELVGRNAELNDVSLDTLRVEWTDPERLLDRAPFDLVLAADVLYERDAVTPLRALLAGLAPEAWIADPGRRWAPEFLEGATDDWRTETSERGVVRIHQLATRRRRAGR